MSALFLKMWMSLRSLGEVHVHEKLCRSIWVNVSWLNVKSTFNRKFAVSLRRTFTCTLLAISRPIRRGISRLGPRSACPRCRRSRAWAAASSGSVHCLCSQLNVCLSCRPAYVGPLGPPSCWPRNISFFSFPSRQQITVSSPLPDRHIGVHQCHSLDTHHTRGNTEPSIETAKVACWRRPHQRCLASLRTSSRMSPLSPCPIQRAINLLCLFQLSRLLPLPNLRLLQGAESRRPVPAHAMAHVLGGPLHSTTDRVLARLVPFFRALLQLRAPALHAVSCPSPDSGRTHDLWGICPSPAGGKRSRHRGVHCLRAWEIEGRGHGVPQAGDRGSQG